MSKDEIREWKGKETFQNQKWANIRGTPCKLTKIGVLQRFLQKKEGEEMMMQDDVEYKVGATAPSQQQSRTTQATTVRRHEGGKGNGNEREN